jgi:hypothetical protein
MALVQTSAAAALSATDLIMTVTSATGFAAGYPVRVDSEFMLVAPSYVSGTAIPLMRRGDNGSAQVAHTILATVVVGSGADWVTAGVDVPLATQVIVNIGADSTIVFPSASTTYMISKATAAAITLSAPASKGADNVRATFLSETAAAHVITYTPGFYGDTTSSDLATFAAKVGASATFIASRGLVGAYALANVTIA